MDMTLLVILGFGFLMSFIAIIGGIFAFLPETTLQRWLKPLIAFSAGSLLGGALFHLLPRALSQSSDSSYIMLGVALGFSIFLALDQVLEWHHCHRLPSEHVQPLGPLMMFADGVHNFLGGISIGAIFIIDYRAGVAAWIAAAMHEIPQEIGDFGVMVHAGYSRMKALLFNFISALTFPLGGVVAYLLDGAVNISFIVALGAGNFLYIAGADLIPEIKKSHAFIESLTRFLFFGLGVGILYFASLQKHH